MSDALVDVVMMSSASTPELRRMTQRAVDTCIAGAAELPVNVVVMEQQREIYRKATTFSSPGKFHYNAFANRGAAVGSAEWIMVANNDLIFHPGWLRHLLAAHEVVVSPKCPQDWRQAGFTENTAGYDVGYHFSGWCFMLRRALWEKIGGLDECVDFWCSDDVVVEQLKAAGVTPLLVVNAVVEHLVSVTLNQAPDMDDLMWQGLDTFNRKYGREKYADDPRFMKWKRENRDRSR